MAFNPDKYLAKESKSFDPDAYLEKEPAQEKPMVTGRGLLKGALEALPVAGSMAGGALGFASPVPGGTILGAGLGGGLGKSLQNIGEKYLLDEDKTREQIYSEPAQATLEGATAEMGGQLIAPAAGLIGKGIKNTVSSLSKVPKTAIDTYLKRGKDVEKLVEKYGANTQESSNALRQEINNSVTSFKNQQNSKISKALDAHNDIIDVTGAVKELEAAKNKLNPSFDKDKIAQIDEALQTINEAAPSGLVDIKTANSMKQFLQEKADYLEPGQYFKKKGLIDVALERAAANTNREITKVAPEIREANKNLQAIRRSTKNLNRNLLKEGETEASLLAAGGGTDKNALSLRKLGEATGNDFMSPVQDIAAQRAFADPGLLPGFNTGASTIPLLLGGAYAGKEALEGDMEGAAKGLLLGAAGSPLALKYGIRAARPLLRGARAAEPLLRQLPKGLLRGD